MQMPTRLQVGSAWICFAHQRIILHAGLVLVVGGTKSGLPLLIEQRRRILLTAVLLRRNSSHKPPASDSPDKANTRRLPHIRNLPALRNGRS